MLFILSFSKCNRLSRCNPFILGSHCAPSPLSPWDIRSCPRVALPIPSYLWGSSGVYSVRQAQTRALQRVYLEVGCVHVCTLWYTHVYTMVYLRVYSSPLGSRYTRGEFTPRIPILLPQSLPDLLRQPYQGWSHLCGIRPLYPIFALLSPWYTAGAHPLVDAYLIVGVGDHSVTDDMYGLNIPTAPEVMPNKLLRLHIEGR